MLKCYIWYCLCLELRIILDTLHKCVRLWTEDVFLFAAKYVNLFFLTLGAFFSIHQIPPKWSPKYCASSLIFSLIEKNAPHAKSCIKILKVCRISGKVQITVRFGYYISLLYWKNVHAHWMYNGHKYFWKCSNYIFKIFRPIYKYFDPGSLFSVKRLKECNK